MTKADVAFYLSIASAALAAALAVLRAYEFFRDRRPSLKAVVSFVSDPDIGHTVALLNSSKVPANIWNFSLVHAEPGALGRRFGWLRRIDSEEFPLEFEFADITVPPYAQASLEFRERHYFAWGSSQQQDIYLKLWLVGRRKPLWFRLTGPPLKSKPR